MANANDKYFELWLGNEVDLARRYAANEQRAIDAKSAAEGWYKSGRRIIESIRLIAETCLPLADKAFAKASEHASSIHFELARQAVTALLDVLSSEIPSQIRKVFHPPHDRMLQEAQRRLLQVRDDVEAKAEMERARLEAVEEKNADRDTREREATALERFQKLPRWSLLSVLVWIATRDMGCVSRAFCQGEDIDGVNISIAVSRALDGIETIHRTVGDAWAQEMAPALSDGKISGSGTLVVIEGALERREVGHIFPSPLKPREADHLRPTQWDNEVALSPRGAALAGSWTDWRDLVFAKDDVLRHWPAPVAAADAPARTGYLTEIARLLARDHPQITAPNEQPANSPAVELATQAILEVFPGGMVPRELSAKQRDNRIFRWCDEQGHGKPSPRSINRAFQRLRHKQA